MSLTHIPSTEPRIRDITLAVLAELKWPFEPYQGNENVLRIPLERGEEDWVCYAQIDEAHRELNIYSVASFEVDEDWRTEVMEYINRVNYGIRLGNFEMDIDDGELRYKTSINTGGGPINAAQVRTLFVANVDIFEKFLPGVFYIMDGSQKPREAFEKIRDQK